jgi:hypothetical protein
MLFIIDTRSVKYLNKHPNILLLDYMYKTNKFNMLLFNILSVDYYSNLFMSQNANDQGRFVIIKTRLTTKRKRECKKKGDYIHIVRG